MSRPAPVPYTVNGKTYPSMQAYILSPEYQKELLASFPPIAVYSGGGGVRTVSVGTSGGGGSASAAPAGGGSASAAPVGSVLTPSTAVSHINPYSYMPTAASLPALSTTVQAETNAQYRARIAAQKVKSEYETKMVKNGKKRTSRRRRNLRNSRKQRRH
jgi:hypothetical protein